MTEAILDEPVFDETTKEYFREVIRCQERIAQAGFPNPGKLMILCRLYDALLDVDFESLNRHGVKFLEDNDSNRDLFQDYADTWRLGAKSFDKYQITLGSNEPPFLSAPMHLLRDSSWQQYLRKPDIERYLIPRNQRLSSSFIRRSRSSSNSIQSSSISYMSSIHLNNEVRSFASGALSNSKSINSSSSSSSNGVVRGNNSSRSFPYVGVKNLGNTCYLASAIQLAFHSGPIKDAILEVQLPSDVSVLAHQMVSTPKISDNFGAQGIRLTSYNLALGLIQLQLLFKDMSDPSRSPGSPADPSAFFAAFPFDLNTQEAVYEFWDTVIVFYIQFLQKADSLLTVYRAHSGDDFHSICALMIDNFSSLEEVLDAREKYNGNLMPPMLIVSVERTYQVRIGDTFIDKKRTDAFTFPDSLDGSMLCETVGDTFQSVHYWLRSFIVHDGNFVDRGHYRIFIYNIVSSVWIELNDSRATKVDPNSNHFKTARAQASVIQYIHTNHRDYESFKSHDLLLSG